MDSTISRNGEGFNEKYGVTDSTFCRRCDLYRPCFCDNKGRDAHVNNPGVVAPIGAATDEPTLEWFEDCLRGVFTQEGIDSIKEQTRAAKQKLRQGSDTSEHQGREEGRQESEAGSSDSNVSVP